MSNPAAPTFIVIRGPSRGRGFPRGWVHQNIGAPQSWIVGVSQTCHWYRHWSDADKAAAALNTR